MSQKPEVAPAEAPPQIKPTFGTWVSVKDATPTRGRPVLIRVHGRAWCKAHYNGGVHDLWYSEKGVAYTNGIDVDAWMPGPPP